MTDEQFDKVEFYKGMKVKFCGDVHEVGGVDFATRNILILFVGKLAAWTRCGNCAIIPQGYHDVNEFYAEGPNFTREV